MRSAFCKLFLPAFCAKLLYFQLYYRGSFNLENGSVLFVNCFGRVMLFVEVGLLECKDRLPWLICCKGCLVGCELLFVRHLVIEGFRMIGSYRVESWHDKHSCWER